MILSAQDKPLIRDCAEWRERLVRGTRRQLFRLPVKWNLQRPGSGRVKGLRSQSSSLRYNDAPIDDYHLPGTICLLWDSLQFLKGVCSCGGFKTGCV